MAKLFDVNGKEVIGVEKYRSELQERLWELEKHTRSEIARRADIQQRRAKLKQQKDVYSADYIERELSKVEKEEKLNREEAWTKANELLENLYNTLQERYNEPLDLSDTRLPVVFDLLELGGPKLERSELAGVVEQFIGNPAALKALRAVFDNLGLDDTVVSEWIYSPGDILTALKEQADWAFRQGNSINGFATAVNKIAKKEGMTFPKDGGTIDPGGVTDSMRAAAGLPE